MGDGAQRVWALIEALGQFNVVPRTGEAMFLASGLIEEVGVGVFDAVIVGDWNAVGVRVVDSGGAGDHGFGHFQGRRRDDGDQLAQEIAFSAQVGCPLGGSGSPF
jgi:hypothetical protein